MPGNRTRLSDFIPYRMAITSSAVTEVIASEYHQQFGLRIPEWRVMAVLGDTDRLTQRELVSMTLMDKVAINRACKGLEERGLVRRSPNAADGRSHHLELTGDGRSIYERIWPQAIEAYARIFAVLTPRETTRLRELLDKVLRSVQRIERDWAATGQTQGYPNGNGTTDSELIGIADQP